MKSSWEGLKINISKGWNQIHNKSDTKQDKVCNGKIQPSYQTNFKKTKKIWLILFEIQKTIWFGYFYNY